MSTLPPDPEILTLAATIGGLSLDAGPWLAGGAVRAWLTGREFADDFDLFFATEEQADAVEAALIAAGAVTKAREDMFRPSAPDPDDAPETVTLRSTYYALPGVGIVNVARTYLWPDAATLLRSFDFTVCMAATDGVSVVTDPRFEEDCRARRLVVNRETTHYRVGKYIGKGFRLSAELDAVWLATAFPTPIPGLVAPKGVGGILAVSPSVVATPDAPNL